MATTKTPRAVRAGGARKAAAGKADAAGAGMADAVGAGKVTASRTPKLPKSVVGAVHAAHDRKAVDVVVLDLRKAGGFTDYFVICTGTNPRQINAIADAVADTLRKDFDEGPALAEGVHKSEWILLDYFNFVVHVFSRECRAFYGLERLWGNAERYECDE